ncbi:MAG: terminase family protein [Phycisphaerales bacterium]
MNLKQLRRDIQTFERLVARQELADLTDGIAAGDRPQGSLVDLYCRLTEAQAAFIDSTVGGDDYEQALLSYRQALAAFQSLLPSAPGRMDPAKRWYPLRRHDGQRDLWTSPARFKIAACGRRSGKTELAKRYALKLAMGAQQFADARYLFCGPTFMQAKRVFWKDVKALIGRHNLAGESLRAISESELTIRLTSGAEVCVIGLDKPERAEGTPIDFAVIDEAADTREDAWTEHLRPGLSERGGRAWICSTPEGRNWFFRLCEKAQTEQKDHPDLWSFHCWPSSDILPPQEIEIAKAELDERTYRQEYEASFETASGRVFYPFDRAIHARHPIPYNPELPLLIGFDFNVSPGTAVICQEIPPGVVCDPHVSYPCTGVIDEVWIPDNSNTRRVCDYIIQSYGDHPGIVTCFGDASGGARGTAKVQGSDWDLVRAFLEPTFGSRLKFRVPRKNPAEKVKVNTLNSRLLSADGTVHLLLARSMCPRLMLDFEGVVYTPDGDIDKDADKWLTHLVDGLAYMLCETHPLVRHLTVIEQL